MTGYDIIGDVHGCAAELKELLGRLGYERDGAGVHRHPDRTAIFIGDLVDRGDGQLDVLEIVKGMHDAGSAQVIMGNHEFNAICYKIPDPKNPGKFLRDNDENEDGHSAFLALKERQWEYLEWFRTLPLWLELDGPDEAKLRLIHACWHPESMKAVKKHCGSERLTANEHYEWARDEEHPLYRAVENLLKGPEISLTDRGHEPYMDFGDKVRTDARVRWWDRDAKTLDKIADVRKMRTEDGSEPYPDLPPDEVEDFDFSLIYTDEVPLIYGHYWFDWDNHLDDWTEYTACVDFGAVGKSGKLVAYRWNGEATISPENYVPHDAVAATPSD